MRKIAPLIILVLSLLTVQAQTADVIDSLRRNIDTYPAPDSFRVKAIYQYLRTNLYNSSGNRPYITEMLAISRKINFPYGIRKGLSMWVKYHGDRGDFNQSFLYADSLITFLKNDSSTVARRERAILYWDLANNYNYLGDYNKSIEYYLLAVEIFEKLDVKNHLCSLYGNVSMIYTYMSDTAKSLEYMDKALAIAEASDDDDLKCRTLMNYANEMLNKGNLISGGEHLDKIEPIVLKLQNNAYAQYFYYLKGDLAFLQKDYSEAINHLKKSLQLAKIENEPQQVANVMSLLFDCYIATNNLTEAKIYIDSTLHLAKKSGLKKRIKEAYDGLAVWNEKKGEFRSANEYLRKAIALNDSILSEENNKHIASLETRYQVANKEREIENLKTEKELQRLSIQQKNILNYVLIGAAIALMIISLLIYRNYKHKQKLQLQRINELETEKQLAATEAVLKGEEKERSRIAKDLHDGLGGMLSGIKYSFNTMKENLVMTPENHQAFERSMDMLDSSIKEMRRVAHNMMPESLVRFGLDTALKDFCHDINQSGALQVSYQSIGLTGIQLDQTTAITVYRVVQELINNTLKHAGARTAIVQVSTEGKQLSVTVEDDGRGFDTTILTRPSGIGWNNIKSRIEFLKGKFDINSQLGKGTSVLIEVPA